MAHRCRPRGLSEKSHLIAFQHQTSQMTRGIGASIYIDAIRMNFWFSSRGMTVHDNLTEIFFVPEKVFANPK